MKKAALDAAYQGHPERIPHGAPRALLPPTEVSINPITSTAVIVGPSASVSPPVRS